jgi:hypothetical protein
VYVGGKLESTGGWRVGEEEEEREREKDQTANQIVGATDRYPTRTPNIMADTLQNSN